MSVHQALLDLFSVRDVFVNGLASVEDIGGGNLRFVFYAVQDRERVVAAKLVMSAVAVPDAMHLTAVSTNTCACQNARPLTRN